MHCVVSKSWGVRPRHLMLALMLASALYYGLYYGMHNYTQSKSITLVQPVQPWMWHESSSDMKQQGDSLRRRLPSSKQNDTMCVMQPLALGELNQTRADQLAQRFQLDWTLALPEHHTAWTLAAQWVTDTQLYPEHHPHMGAVLKSLAEARVMRVTTPWTLGHNFKLMLQLEGGQQALFKLKTYKRDFVKPFTDHICLMKDSNVGDIVAFHLSRILGFRKAPISVGRTLDLHEDIIPVASPELLSWILTTGNRTCFSTHVCTEGSQVEGVAVLWLPESVTLKNFKHPWGRMCRAVENTFEYFKPEISSPEDICREAQVYEPFRNKPGLFLDLVDSSILEFLVQNIDRQLVVGTGEHQHLLLMMDSGKSFFNPDVDYDKILAPLSDCCRLRESTYRRLQSFQHGSLSHVLRVVTRGDPVAPLLTPQHLRALDRRLHAVLTHVHRCVCHHGAGNVLITD